jgi:rhodanese-related sulfurtransferase
MLDAVSGRNTPHGPPEIRCAGMKPPPTIRSPVAPSISPREAERLVAEGAHVLDVRTPEEYEQRGHLPGARLLPSDLVACAPAVLPEDGRPIVVCCEHGVRSRHAAAFLVRAGVPGVVNMAGGMSCWTGPRERGPGVIDGPSSWLLLNRDLLPRRGRALDVASGRGRHALLLAAAGVRVRAVDRDLARIASLSATAQRLDLPVQAEVLDLETAAVDLGTEVYDLVLVVHYLRRPLFPSLVRALAPGGLLLCETFTTAQAARGKPTNPDFLLEKGELVRLVRPLEVLRQREGEFEGRMVASVAARKASG